MSGRHRDYPGPGRVAGSVLSEFPFDNRAGTQRNRVGPHWWGTSWGPPFLHHDAPIAQKKSASLPHSRYGCESRWALQKYVLPSGRGVASNALHSQRRDRGCKSRRSVHRPVVKQHHDRLQNGRSRGGTGLACQNFRYRGVADLHTPLSREKYGVSTRRYRHPARHSVSVRSPVSETGGRWFDSSPGNQDSRRFGVEVARLAEDQKDSGRYREAAPWAHRPKEGRQDGILKIGVRVPVSPPEVFTGPSLNQ